MVQMAECKFQTLGKLRLPMFVKVSASWKIGKFELKSPVLLFVTISCGLHGCVLNGGFVFSGIDRFLSF